MMNAFKEFGAENAAGPFNRGTIGRHSSIWQISYGGLRPAQAVAHTLLYADSPSQIVLERKGLLAAQVLAQQLHPAVISHYTAEALLPLYAEMGNWCLVAAHLGVSNNGMYKHVRKLGLPRRQWTPRNTLAC